MNGDRKMRLVAWRPLTKGALRGFATVELPIGLTISDCPVLISHGKTWASMPAKPILDRDGRQKADANGKASYASILSWRDRDLADRWSAAVVDLVRAEYPDAIDGSAA
jgi:hypothetical protein